MQLSDEEDRKWKQYLLLIYDLSEEQIQTLEGRRPMTQRMFDNIMDVCIKTESRLEFCMFALMEKYPEFLSVYAENICAEIKEDDRHEK